MAISKLTLCNRALSRVGQAKLITDFDAEVAANQKSAVACNLIFTETLQEAARGGDWNCLRARAEILGVYAEAYDTYIDGNPCDTEGATEAAEEAVALITDFILEGARDCHRSGGSWTCASASMIG